MGGRPKKRRSAVQSFETVPNPKKQILLTTKKLTTVRDKHLTWSAPSMRQQSITQMDGLRDYYHPELENEDLETNDEEAGCYVASPTRNKRRKIAPEKPLTRKIETRSAKRKAAKENPSIPEQGAQVVLPSAAEEAKAHTSRGTMPTAMLPPKTPMSLRRREIPSSQSPGDTPLSTQSRQSLQDYTRSPLKEKSTNIVLSVNSPRKGTHRPKKLEVADSMETLDEDSPVALKVGSTTEVVEPIAEPEGITEKEPQLPSRAFEIHVNDFNQRLQAAQRPVQEIPNSSQARRRHEVVDSTDEEEDDEEAEAFSVGPETQAALATTESSHRSPHRPPTSTTASHKDSKETKDEPKLGSIGSNVSKPPESPNPPSSPDRESSLEDHPPMPRLKKAEFINLASSDPPEPTTPSAPRERPSDSQEVSAQLFADLLRDTHSGGLQTETQFERGWTIYTPADDDIHSDLEPLPPTSPPIDQPSSGLMTVPTQLIRPPISSPPKYYKAPVPPSQATTVDVTQPSPRHALPSSSQPIFTQSSPQNDRESPLQQAAHSPQTFPSSPPPMPPSANRKVDPWAGYEWNGVRLTDSQLLPDSLMDDSQAGPPGLSQVSWTEEV